MSPCTCMLYDGPELLRLWRRRATPVLRRWLAKGHRIAQDRVAKTVHLVLMVETGCDEVTSPANAHKSHHLPNCPQSIRRTCTVSRVDTVSSEQTDG